MQIVLKIVVWCVIAFFFLPLVGVIASAIYYSIKAFFSEGEVRQEFRQGCLVWLLLIGGCAILGLCVGYCDRKEKKSTPHAFVSATTTSSTSKPWSGNRLDKDFIDEVEPWDTVFICLGSGSKKFHSTIACPGMQNCNSGADAITREEAEDMGRTHCRRCYN